MRFDDPQPDLALASLVRLPAAAAVDHEWSRFKAGELVSTDILQRDVWSRNDASMTLTMSSRGSTETHVIRSASLPDRGSVKKYTSRYMQTLMWAAFPVLSPHLFETTMRLAYDSIDGEDAHILSARSCIIAFAMFSYLVPLGVPVCSKKKYSEYAAMLQPTLLKLAEAPTVDGFQACIFLVWLYRPSHFHDFHRVHGHWLMREGSSAVITVFHRQI